MWRKKTPTPEIMPILARGRHRSPRSGACFMELASYLAGERWSDHPGCTHPLLADLARQVNDLSSDAGRQRLVRLVPTVIGLTSSDPRTEARLALRAATTALPIVAEELQRVMAVAILSSERVLAELDGRPRRPLCAASRAAFAKAPLAAQWARRHAESTNVSVPAFRTRVAPGVVRSAVHGIARACIADPDAVLYEFLAGAIDDVRRSGAVPEPADVRPARFLRADEFLAF